MNDTEKIATIRSMIGDNSADVSVCLLEATSAVLNRLYPFGTDVTTVPPRYEILECRLASRYFLRRGGEGETMHSENGISRTYASPNDEDLLSEIVPYLKVIV